MINTRSERFRLIAWCLAVFFTLVSIPHFDLIATEVTDLIGTVAYAAEEQVDHPAAPPDSGPTPAVPSEKGQNGAADKSDEKPQNDSTTPPKPKNETSQTSPNTPNAIPEAMLFSGAASYRVPIDLPPGRAGIVPNLAITYNSYQGNGFLGVGWDIDLGAIQRSTKRGVNYSANDFTVVMSGSQADLVAKPAWGSNYYGSKIDETLLKYYYNSSTRGWEVTTKDGQKLYYGTTSDSRQDSSLGVFKWCLDKVVDTNGNYMSVSYTKDQGEIYPDIIRYTGNSGLEPAYEVRFIREARTDAYAIYTNHVGMTKAYRLSEIQVYSRTGSLIRKYALQYTYSNVTSRSLLTSITQSGSDGTALPPTVFEYQDNGLGVKSTLSYSGIGGTVKTTSGDIDGDGKQELLHCQNDNAIYISRIVGCSSLPCLTLGYSGSEARAMSADFNGDGKSDIAGTTILLSNGTTFERQEGWGLPDPNDGRLRLGDFNGDGKTDFLQLSSDFFRYDVYLTNSSGTNFETGWSGSMGGTICFPIYMMPLDLTGDGKTDIVEPCCVGNNSGLTLISTGSGFSYYMSPVCSLPGDFNGDGRTDLLQTVLGASVWFYAYNPGEWGPGFPFVYSPNWTTDDLNNYKLIPIDLNADGKTDLLRFSSSDAYAYISTGSSFKAPFLWRGGLSIDKDNDNIPVGDFDGDGVQDVAISNSAGSTTILLSSSPSDQLSKITTPLGGTSEIKYKPSSAYQNTLMPFILQTVGSITTSDGRGTSSTTSYAYEGGLYNYAEREFLGFRKVTTTTPETTTQTLFSQDLVKKGKVEQATTTSKEGHTRQVDNTYEIRSLDGGASFPALISSVTTVTDVGATPFTITNTLDYDSYLNVKSSQTSGEGPYSTVLTETQYTDFADKWIVSKPTMVTVKGSSGNIMSRKWLDYDSITGNLTLEEVCKCDIPNTGCSSRNSTQNPQVSYTYYPEGNVQTITDPLGNVSTFTYDDSKTHVYNKTNALGHVTTTVYNNGQLVSMIPPHLQGTAYSFTYTYDSLGRRNTETRPDGGWSKYTYNNLGSPTEQYTTQTEHIAGGVNTYSDLVSKSYFDGLGRTYKTITPGTNGNVISETVFDSLGRVAQKSIPHYSTDDTYYSTFEYDGLSRPTKATGADGSTGETTYQGLNKQIKDQRGYVTTYTYDVYNRLVAVVDAKGTQTLYAHDVLGNLLGVSAAQGLPEQNVTRITYDSLSKKRSMTDPDMGYWYYEYDKAGNIISQIDGKGQTTTFEYDALGRITKKITPDRKQVTYTYDNPAVSYSRGQLTQMTAEASVDTVEAFDMMQRPIKILKTVKTLSRRTEKTYDSAGRVATITYSLKDSPKTYSYTYDWAGNIWMVKDPEGKNIVTYSNYSALGQVESAAYPAREIMRIGPAYDLNKTWIYSPQTGRVQYLRTSQTMRGSHRTFIIQDLEYQFDAKGNLTVLTDKQDGTTHNYTYDELDRLTNAQGTGTRIYTKEYRYDVLGNIIYNSDVGDYSYNYQDKPHAVRTAGRITLNYDANGNMISRNDPSLDPTTIEYNSDNKPSGIIGYAGQKVSFSYDGNGRRVIKDSPMTVCTTYYFGELYEQQNDLEMNHIFAHGRLATFRSDGVVRIYHQDHLGSTSLATDANGNIVQKNIFYPFGTQQYVQGYLQVNYMFTGQEDDDELGFYNYNARLYDPQLGRFISADTLVPEPGNLQSLNRYSYCLNNPLIYIDPSGHFFFAIFVGMILGALVAGIQSNWNPQAMFIGGLIGGISGGVYAGVSGAVSGALVGVVENSIVAGAISGAVAGAAAGASAGAMGAAITGGNIGAAMLKGAGMGALAGAAFGAIGGHYGDSWSLGRVGLHTLAGGGVSTLAGEGFGKGALFAGVMAMGAYTYTKVVGYKPTWEPGIEAEVKNRDTMPSECFNNVGTQGGPIDPNGWWNEGGRVSSFANEIPGINCVAGAHDVFQVSIDKFFEFNALGAAMRTALNVPAMIPAAVLGYGALMTDANAMILYSNSDRFK